MSRMSFGVNGTVHGQSHCNARTGAPPTDFEGLGLLKWRNGRHPPACAEGARRREGVVGYPIENLEHLAEASWCLGGFHPLTTSERIRCKAQGLRDLCLAGPQRARDLRGREQARLRCKRRIESYSHLSSLISLSIVMGCDIATGVPGGRFFGIDWWRWYQGAVSW
jgi:hypothetical protein